MPQKIIEGNSQFNITPSTTLTFVDEAKPVANLINQFLSTGSMLTLEQKKNDQSDS